MNQTRRYKNGFPVVGVCVAGVESYYQSSMSNCLNVEANKAGISLVYFVTFTTGTVSDKHDAGEEKIYDYIQYDLLDALIVFTETIKSDVVKQGFIDGAKTAGIPLISMDGTIKGAYNILFKYKEAMEEIIRHMVVFHGCRNVEFIGGIPGFILSDERDEAFIKVLTENGLAIDPRRMHHGGFWGGPTNVVMDRIFARQDEVPLPEAIICANDSMAMQVHRRLTEAGYNIPGDIKLTGFDGIEQAQLLIPAITTAIQDFEKAASVTADLLTRLFAGEEVGTDYYVDFKIIYEDSCGCGDRIVRTNTVHLSKSYDIRENFYRLSKRISSMVNDLHGCNSIETGMKSIGKYVPYINAAKFWIAVDEYEHPLLKVRRGRGKISVISNNVEMDSVSVQSYVGGDLIDNHTNVPVRELLPSIREELKNFKNMMFVPLHVADESMGYMVVGVNGVWEDPNLYQLFSISLSASLQMIRSLIGQQFVIKQLEYDYIHDALTEIYNRRGFNVRVGEIFKECIERQGMIMLVSIDMDGLKNINDTYGHKHGDEALITVSRIISEVAGDKMICARFGGDEFIAVGTTGDVSEAEGFKQRLEERLDHYNATSGKPYDICASYGSVTLKPSSIEDIEDYINQADRLMYRHKDGKKRKLA